MTTSIIEGAQSEAFTRGELPDGIYGASATVRRERLGGSLGIMAIEGGALVGFAGYREVEGLGLYAHSLASWGSPHVAAALVKRVRLIARSLGYGDLFFHVQTPDLGLMALVPRHASVESAILRMKA